MQSISWWICIVLCCRQLSVVENFFASYDRVKTTFCALNTSILGKGYCSYLDSIELIVIALNNYLSRYRVINSEYPKYSQEIQEV